MKILFISMPSIHAIRWIENLKDTEYELFWFDVLGRGKLETIEAVKQFTDWKQRKLPYIKGEYFINKKLPFLYNMLQPFLEVTANEKLEQIIKEIQPDIVHSFEMQSCSYPILKTMTQYPSIKWIYSCWGSDLFYYQNIRNHNSKIREVLKRINSIHTDCLRDYEIAKSLGFKGEHLGIIPGGSGYQLDILKQYYKPLNTRKIILVKGYQHKFGRGLTIVKALQEIHQELQNYEVVVFGAHQSVIDYIIQHQLPFKVYNRHELKHDEILKLMGRSLIYIGNSISDGLPNTLLEAIIMGAFPIQSNPGNVTAELIENGINGLLINNPEDLSEIKMKIEKVILLDKEGEFEKAAEINSDIAKKRLDFALNRQKIVNLYQTNDISEVSCE